MEEGLRDKFYLSEHDAVDGLARRIDINGRSFAIELNVNLFPGDRIFASDDVGKLYIGTFERRAIFGGGPGISIKAEEPEAVRGQSITLFDHGAQGPTMRVKINETGN